VLRDRTVPRDIQDNQVVSAHPEKTEIRVTLEQLVTLAARVRMVRLDSPVCLDRRDNLEPVEAPEVQDLPDHQARRGRPVPLDYWVCRGFLVPRVQLVLQVLPEVWAQLELLVVQDSLVCPDSLEQQVGRAPQVPQEPQVQQAQQVLRVFPVLMDFKACQEDLVQQDYQDSPERQAPPGSLD
jgi:hypothetical protein